MYIYILHCVDLLVLNHHRSFSCFIFVLYFVQSIIIVIITTTIIIIIDTSTVFFPNKSSIHRYIL